MKRIAPEPFTFTPSAELIASGNVAMRRADIQEALKISLVLANRLAWALGQADNTPPEPLCEVAIDGLKLNYELWIEYSTFLSDLTSSLKLEHTPTSF